MTSRLTLIIEKSVVIGAKAYAKKNSISLSELVEKYLEKLTTEGIEKKELSPQLKAIVGRVSLPSNFNEEAELLKYLHSKHYE